MLNPRFSAGPLWPRPPLILVTCAALSTRVRAPSDPPASLYARARVSAHARTTRRSTTRDATRDSHQSAASYYDEANSLTLQEAHGTLSSYNGIWPYYYTRPYSYIRPYIYKCMALQAVSYSSAPTSPTPTSTPVPSARTRPAPSTPAALMPTSAPSLYGAIAHTSLHVLHSPLF